jgi:hypothetical protein
MTASPRPRRVLPEGISLARLRGKVEITRDNRAALYHFAIIATGMVAFVRVRYEAQILAMPAEILAEFREDISRLRVIVQNTAISPELWLRSRHGTWRFFRVTAEGLIEISQAGVWVSG